MFPGFSHLGQHDGKESGHARSVHSVPSSEVAAQADWRNFFSHVLDDGPMFCLPWNHSTPKEPHAVDGAQHQEVKPRSACL